MSESDKTILGKLETIKHINQLQTILHNTVREMFKE